MSKSLPCNLLLAMNSNTEVSVGHWFKDHTVMSGEFPGHSEHLGMLQLSDGRLGSCLDSGSPQYPAGDLGQVTFPLQVSGASSIKW